VDFARSNGFSRLRIRCVVVSTTSSPDSGNRIPRWTGSSDYTIDPYVNQIVKRLCVGGGPRRIVGEAPVPLEFETPDWEPPSEEQFDRRIPDDEPWDVP